MSDWIITNCVFEGDPPEGGWPEWIKASVAKRRIEGLRISLLTEDIPDGCDYDDCINYEENELCYRWSSGECTGPRMPK